jgi:hypothetical protein
MRRLGGIVIRDVGDRAAVRGEAMMMVLEFVFTLLGALMVAGGILLGGLVGLHAGPFGALALVTGITIGFGAFLAGLSLLWFAAVLRMLAGIGALMSRCALALEREGTTPPAP